MYKIYKIVDNTNDNVYIGITRKTLKERLGRHERHNNCVSRDIIKNGDYRMELIEQTDDKMRERYWIENTECINKQIPGRTQKEWREKNKEILAEKNKKYREKNKEKIAEKKKEYNKEYNENNKHYMKEYREENKEKITDKQKEWYKKNKDKIKENTRIRCKWNSSMGGEPNKNNMSLLKIDVNLFS